MKICKECGEQKPKTSYYAHRETKDRLRPICKQCWKHRNEKYYANNKKTVKLAMYYYRLKNPEVKAAATIRYQKKYPEKIKAVRAVNNAIRDGRLYRGPCEVCGKTVGVQGHHDDYGKPLDVRWLCVEHHNAVHNHSLPVADDCVVPC